MNYPINEISIPQIASFPYSAAPSMAQWVETIAHEIWHEMLQAPHCLESLHQNEPGYLPRSWTLPGGWSVYDVANEKWTEIVAEDLPKCMVLDIESQRESANGPYRPVLAIAMSVTSWYGWRWDGVGLPVTIPFPPGRIVVGHNIRPYDARYLSCEYDLNADRTVFIDTRQLAKSWRGITQAQIPFYKQCQKNVKADKGAPQWFDHALMESLEELSFRVLGKSIDKTARSSLEKWDMEGMRKHLREKLPLAIQQKLDEGILTYGELVTEASQLLATFQDLAPTNLAQYCAQDVHSTYQLFQHLWVLATRNLIPSVVSWIGMQELSNMRVVTQPQEQQEKQEQSRLDNDAECFKAEVHNIAFDITASTHPHLDWNRYKSGPNKDQHKWLVQCQKDEWSSKCRSVVSLLKLTWDGTPIEWRDRRWMAGGDFLPSVGDRTKPLTSSPFQWGYVDYVGRLQSEVLGDRFAGFFLRALMACMPLSDFNEAYIADVEGVPMSVAGVMPLGGLAHEPSGLTFLASEHLESCSLVRLIAPSDQECVIAEWIASTVANRSVKLEGDRLSLHHLVRGCDGSKLIAEGLPDTYDEYLERNAQIEACLNDLAHRPYAHSLILGWRMSEGIDVKFATMLDPRVRREWLIDGVKTDLIHIFLSVLRAFLIEYELTAQLIEVHHSSTNLVWMVVDEDKPQFKQCCVKAWEVAVTAGAEWMAGRVSQVDGRVMVPSTPQIPSELIGVAVV